MKTINSFGITYIIEGAREEEAAIFVEEGLSAVTKRRSAYIDNNLDVIIEEAKKDYGVEISIAPRMVS